MKMLHPLKTIAIPEFLVPAFARSAIPHSRHFSRSRSAQSRIGAAALNIPQDVQLTLFDPPQQKGATSPLRVQPPRNLEVKGPLGTLNVSIPTFIDFTQDAQLRKASLAIPDKTVRKHREMWGTTRAYVNNHILGVSEGHIALLRMVGVGYRASVEATSKILKPEYPGQQFVNLRLGYAHPIDMAVPEGIKVTTPQPTRIMLEGPDRQALMQFAAEIRRWRRPEPYKGKGIFVNDETIKLKAKKIK